MGTNYDQNSFIWYENVSSQGQRPLFKRKIYYMGDYGRRLVLPADITKQGTPALVFYSTSTRSYPVEYVRYFDKRYFLKEHSMLSVVEKADDINSNSIRYAISHGPDKNLFRIDELSGQLTFGPAPSVGAPQDSNSDNIYEVAITASNGKLTSTRWITVFVY